MKQDMLNDFPRSLCLSAQRSSLLCSNKRQFVIQVIIRCHSQEHSHYIEFQWQSIHPSFHPSFHFIGSTMSHTDPFRNQQQQQQQGDQPPPRTSERPAPSQPPAMYPLGAAAGAFAHHHHHPYAAAPPHMLYHPTAATIATAGYPQHPLLAPTTAATATVSEKYRYIYLVWFSMFERIKISLK